MRCLLFAFLIGAGIALVACGSSKPAAIPPDASVGDDAGPVIDAAPGPTGHEARATVPGGVKASSPNYKLIGTTGKSTNTASSPNYRVRTGVVGASQE